ncbi:MAG TPA: universal stress protein [Hanamia sp.]|nr:universal stress protein [Hanamia sp.]
MKKIIVPIDFSDTSVNAARYAIELAKDIPGANITLYYVYNRINLSDLTSKDAFSRQMVSEAALKILKDKLDIGFEPISYVAEAGSFVENLADYVLGNHIDLVIMGITGSSKLAQVFMGTNTLNVIRNISCPVMIIPPEAKYTGLKKVVFTSDFKDVARTTPFAIIKKILDTFKPKLDILNVDSEHFVELTPEFKIEKENMEDKLGAYNPEFSFLRSYDFLEGISSFVESRKMDAIITVPRKHTLFNQFFVTSSTKKLAYHSTVPIIAIPV